MTVINELQSTAYLAAEGFEAELGVELGEVGARYERLFVAPGGVRPAAWAQNVWYDPVVIEIASIKQGIKALRDIQRNWVLYPFAARGRAKLIAEGLPKVSAKPLHFGDLAPTGKLGSWTMLSDTSILAAPSCSSPFAHGEAHFVEDKIGPPSRAYLKLWEALTLTGVKPGPGDVCLDLGGSPGGWAWVLGRLGASVTSVDKAPLDPKVTAMANVTWLEGSAFGVEPKKFGPVDWLFSDVICYPERLYAMVSRWLDAGMSKNFVCTVKFQGPTDFEAMERFRAIPGSRLLHLFHNKHELTWIRLAEI